MASTLGVPPCLWNGNSTRSGSFAGSVLGTFLVIGLSKGHLYSQSMDLYRWRMARKHGTVWLEIENALSNAWETFWLCWVRGEHQEKMQSHGCCYRCGKALR